jgi:ATP-dependent RNA/DNA helicase IGHMBP2
MDIPGISVMLTTQYRMHEWIMNYSNQKFYQNNLKADISVKDRLLSVDPDHYLLNVPVEFIDTAGCGYTEVMNPESLSIANPEEAQLLLKHLKLVLQQYAIAGSDKKITIGVISPYKEQVQYLTTILAEDEELKSYPSAIAVKTVDGFQGQEKDIIYISLVRSNEQGEIGFLNDIRRMNVALTRAKKKLVVIGDSATLGNHPFYKDFLEYTEHIQAYKSAWEYTD